MQSEGMKPILPKMWQWTRKVQTYPKTSSQVEEAKIPKEIPSAVRLAIMRVHKNLGHPSRELFCRALRIGGAKKIAIRAASELKCDVCSENKPPKSHLPAKLADTYTEFNQGVGVDLFVLADSNEQVYEFLNIVDLATRFNICFPMPSKRPDDVLSVLEMVWINLASLMSHLISHMGGSLWKLTAFDIISRHPKLPGRTDLLNVTVEPGKRLRERQSKMSEHEVSRKCEDSPPW